MTATETATYPGTPLRIHATEAEREVILRSLAELVAWLTAHPEAPLPRWGHEWLVSCRDSAGVMYHARALGIMAGAPAHATRAVVRFGPVAYVLYAANTEVPA